MNLHAYQCLHCDHIQLSETYYGYKSLAQFRCELCQSYMFYQIGEVPLVPEEEK